MSEKALNDNENLIWSVAEIQRGDFKQSEYQKVVLPLTVLRRLDAVLTPQKEKFLSGAEKVAGMEGAETALESIARTTYGHTFYNTSPLDFEKLTADADNVAGNLRSYIAGFSPDVQDVFTRFNFDPIITRLDKNGLLYQVIGRFVDADHEQEQFWGSRQMTVAAAEALSRIVEEMNQRFGDGLAEEDRLVIDQYESAFLNHEEVVTAALANDNIGDFIRVVFEPVFLDTVITQMNANEKVFKLILADDQMRVLFRDYIAQKVYDEIRRGSDD